MDAMRGVTLLLAIACFSASAKTKVVILGDSLTEGFGVARERAYPALVQKALTQAGKEVEIINGGSSGSTAASGPSRMKWYLKGKPQVLVLALGANDALRGLDLERSENSLSTTIALAKQNGMKVLLVGMKIPTNYGKHFNDGLEQVYVRLAKKHRVPLLPFLLEGVGGKPQFNLADGIHPNEAGHEIMAKLVEKHLLPLL